jgi:hypothetical protein
LECRWKSIECSGYKPKVSLDFKDETQLAARKVQARNRKQAEAKSTARLAARSKSCGQAGAGNKQPSDVVAAVDPHYLPIPILDVALSCFVTQYLPGTFLSDIWPLYTRAGDGSPLFISVYAPALASLAIDSGQPQVMTLARLQYARGIHRTNQALSDPKERTTDDTLAAIVHLSLFETISFDERAVRHNWTAHVLGAVEIVKLRGLGQLETHIGRELYATVILGICFSCVQRGIKMPQDLLDFDSKASYLVGKTHPTYRLLPLLNTFANIQFNQDTCTSSPDETIDQLLRLDDLIASVFAQELMTKDPGTSPADGQYVLGRRRGNTLRTLRLVINCRIQTSISIKELMQQETSSDIDDKLVYNRAHELMKTMGTEILESTQQFLSPRVSLNSHVMILPLNTMSEESLMPLHLRAGARDLLRFIGTEGRIPEALRAAERLDRALPKSVSPPLLTVPLSLIPSCSPYSLPCPQPGPPDDSTPQYRPLHLSPLHRDQTSHP